MPIIDVHNHFYPPAYLDALAKDPGNVRVTHDDAGNPLLHYPGDYNIAVRGHRDIAYREEVLAKHGVDRQVLTLTTPGTHVEQPARAVELARLVNDAFAELVAERGGRFSALATLPLSAPKASASELARCLDSLTFPGAMLFANVNGTSLADERFWPLYEVADAHSAILHIHPTSPVGVESMTEYWLMPLCGFLFDTTLAAAHLVFAGVVERFPRIRWVLSHLGGTTPYLAERLDRGFRAFRECRARISKAPSEYLRAHFWYDTVNFDPAALSFAIQFAGAGRLLAGSDYPHQIGSIPLMLESLDALPVPHRDRIAILGGTAAGLLGL